MTQTPTDALRLVPHDHEVIKRCVDRMPPLYMRGQTEGSYLHSDIATLIDIVGRLAAAPASPLPGGGPHERWSILNHLGESWTPENFETERQATAYLNSWKRDNPKMDLSKHRVIPVLVTMTAAPTGDA